MDITLPMMIQDQASARKHAMQLTEDVVIRGEPFYLDGPITRRVAILDFDPRTGGMVAGARLRASATEGLGRYAVRAPRTRKACQRPSFMQVSTFATVLRAIKMFEEPDTLGREVVWAFSGPQLLVVPRAGDDENAFYERESRALHFFSFTSHLPRGGTIYTSLGHDIVAHETAHAVLDAIAPDLWDVLTPQALALHEAVADLTAAVLSFRITALRNAVLRRERGSIARSNAFSSIADEFGQHRDVTRRAGYLRSLRNRRTLQTVRDDLDPHDLSEVLSGALYSVMMRMHAARRREYVREARREGSRAQEQRAAARALWVEAEHFKRMIFRALDYLPPGELSFADYGRAIIAADQASHPLARRERDWLREQFVQRGIVRGVGALAMRTNFRRKELEGVDLQELCDSDWLAYRFIDRNRHWLGIPKGVDVRVRPRLDVTKVYYRRDRGRIAKIPVRECVVKVSWSVEEDNPPGLGLAPRRRITVGTSLAIDWKTKRVRALLKPDYERHAAKRSAYVRRLLEEGIMQPEDFALGPDGRPLRSVVRYETKGRVLRVRGTARALHIAGGV